MIICVIVLLALQIPFVNVQPTPPPFPGIDEKILSELPDLFANYSELVPQALKKVVFKLSNRNRNFKLLLYFGLYSEDVEGLTKLPRLMKNMHNVSNNLRSEKKMRSPVFTSLKDIGVPLTNLILQFTYEDSSNRKQLEEYLKERVKLEFQENQEELDVRLKKQFDLQVKAEELRLYEELVDRTNNAANIFGALDSVFQVPIGTFVQGIWGGVTLAISSGLALKRFDIEMYDMEQSERIVVEEVGKIIYSSTGVIIEGLQMLGNDVKNFVGATAKQSLNITLAALDKMQKNMNEGFKVLSANIKELDDRITERSLILEQHITHEIKFATLAIRKDIYDLLVGKDVIELRIAYYDYLKSSVSIGPRERLLASCKKHRPQTLITTIDQKFQHNQLDTLLMQTNGNLASIEPFFLLLVSDIKTIVQVAPMCIELEHTEGEKKCDKLSIVETGALALLKRLDDKIETYDYSNGHIVQASIQVTLPDIVRRFQAKPEFHADMIVHELSRSYPSLKFLVYISKSEIESFVHPDRPSRQVVIPFIKEYNYTVVVFWHSQIHDPFGYIWDDCYDSAFKYWYNRKPKCIINGYAIEKNISQCGGNTICQIRRQSSIPSIPTCENTEKKLFPCFEAIDSENKPDETCRRDGNHLHFPCTYNDGACARNRIYEQQRNRTVHKPNSTLYDKYKCVEWFPAVAAYPGQKCAPFDAMGIYQWGEYDSIKYKIRYIYYENMFSTSLDCVTYFNFPDASYTVNLLAKNIHRDINPAEIFRVKATFDGFVTTAAQFAQILEEHEMKKRGFCVSGVIKNPVESRISFASNMNGAYMGMTDEKVSPYFKMSYLCCGFIIVYQKCLKNASTPQQPINTLLCNKIEKGDLKLANEFNDAYAGFLKIIKEKETNIANATNVNDASNEDSSNSAGVIAACVVCVILLTIIVTGVLVFVWKKKSKRKDLHWPHPVIYLQKKFRKEKLASVKQKQLANDPQGSSQLSSSR